MTHLATVISLPDVVLAETMGYAFDAAWIDLEHGSLSARDVAPLTVALRAAGCEAHVRITRAASEALAPALDAGADAIVLPQAEDPEAVAGLARRLRYPPEGERGYGPRRAGRDGQRPPVPRLIAQIESPAGVRAAPAIAGHVDLLVIGTADLGLRVPAPALPAAVAEVEAAARAAGAGFGLAGGEPAALLRLCSRPPDLLVCGVDIKLAARIADDVAAAAREGLASIGTPAPGAGGIDGRW
ncbi:MAG TPA: aldolase/citrate lyase family protein [Solirubrobacter sp.]|nr:aldolase/citrate lyase family protein [Solirubrobacter sp.]